MSAKRLMVPQGVSIEGHDVGPGEPYCTDVPPGRYIINWERENEYGDVIVCLAGADWEDDDDHDSDVTYHSTKYLYTVKRSDLVLEKFDLLTAMQEE